MADLKKKAKLEFCGKNNALLIIIKLQKLLFIVKNGKL